MNESEQQPTDASDYRTYHRTVQASNCPACEFDFHVTHDGIRKIECAACGSVWIEIARGLHRPVDTPEEEK
jgi:Zn ribbon nucleic-acid-binding protein